MVLAIKLGSLSYKQATMVLLSQESASFYLLPR